MRFSLIGVMQDKHNRQVPFSAALLSVLLLMTVAASTNQRCGISLQQTLRLTRLAQKESVDLIKTYKAYQGDLPEFVCKVSLNDVPDPNISGLDLPERIVSIYTHLQAFYPHFKRVYEQQKDLQTPTNQLLTDLTTVSVRSNHLAASVKGIYQSLFPNVPLPEPAGGPTTLPPPQNVFQQKVYGCVVLKTYKELLSNISKELRTLKNKKVCNKI